MMIVDVQDWINLPAMVTIMKRHRFSEGFCSCCGQPWPCDVRLVQGLVVKDLGESDVVSPV